jgi:hypothetical protein
MIKTNITKIGAKIRINISSSEEGLNFVFRSAQEYSIGWPTLNERNRLWLLTSNFPAR